MSMNTFGHLFRVTTWGESHGPAIGATVDGCPAGIKIDEKMLLDNLKILASDSLEGRGFSKPGNYKAQKMIANQFQKIGLEAAVDSNFIQEFPYTFSGKRRQRLFPILNPDDDYKNVPDTTVIGGNVLGKITGKTKRMAGICRAFFNRCKSYSNQSDRSPTSRLLKKLGRRAVLRE